MSDQQYAEKMAYQQQRDEIEDKQWQMQFDESVRQYNDKNGKTSSGGGGSKKNPTEQTGAGNEATGGTLADFMAMLNAGPTTAKAGLGGFVDSLKSAAGSLTSAIKAAGSTGANTGSASREPINRYAVRKN